VDFLKNKPFKSNLNTSGVLAFFRGWIAVEVHTLKTHGHMAQLLCSLSERMVKFFCLLFLFRTYTQINTAIFDLLRICGSLQEIYLSPLSPLHKLAGFQEEVQFEVLRRLHQTPHISQRILAKELGVSLGSMNFCFQALAGKGWIKMQNFSQSKNKLRYAYLLTPNGLAQKSKLTAEFLRRKVKEYEALQEDIEALKSELLVTVQTEEGCLS